MPIYEITAPNGKTYEVEGNGTQEQALAYFKANYKPEAPTKEVNPYEASMKDALANLSGTKKIMGGALAGLGGETIKNVGALTELISPQYGKPIAQFGEAMTNAAKEANPITGTIGQLGAYIAPYNAMEKVLPTFKALLPNVAKQTAIGGAMGYGLTPDSDNRMLAGAMGGAMGGGVTALAPVANGAVNLVKALREKPNLSTMSGVGAAEVPEALRRVEMAQGLRVPIPLTKGQATKDLGQQGFEIETPKNYPELGKKLLANRADQNDKILQNFDEFIDATGKQSFGLTATGQLVDKALVNSANKAKSEINNAYKVAQEAGETSQLIDVTPIQKYLSGLEAEAINAPVITSAKMKLDKLSQDGQLSINDLEEIRKMVGRVSGDTNTNMMYGKDIKGVIDTTLENQGGNLYKEARALRSKYARDFENIGIIDKLLSKKPGTSDRSVALEDVFSHSILKGSNQDVQNIGLALKKAGLEGQQAWKELQGQTIQHIKDEVTKTVGRDIADNATVSPAAFNKIVRTLDQDGKLTYLFGKKGAEEIRNLLETTLMLNPLKGAENTSNTTSALIRALDLINKTPLKSVPLVGSGAKMAETKLKENIIKKQIDEALNFDPKKLAEQLRKE
jgi:hypothetical protein